MKKITPHLCFDKEAREAAEFYVSLFPGSRVLMNRLTGAPSGDCDQISFDLAGQPFMAIGAGPWFKFNPSISFQAKCGAQEEVDAIWQKLSAGGKVLMPLDAYPFSQRFGWLEDKYGLSWQLLSVAETQMKQRITPVLMFVGNVCGKAEEVINLYTRCSEARRTGLVRAKRTPWFCLATAKAKLPIRKAPCVTRTFRWATRNSALWIPPGRIGFH